MFKHVFLQPAPCYIAPQLKQEAPSGCVFRQELSTRLRPFFSLHQVLGCLGLTLQLPL